MIAKTTYAADLNFGVTAQGGSIILMREFTELTVDQAESLIRELQHAALSAQLQISKQTVPQWTKLTPEAARKVTNMSQLQGRLWEVTREQLVAAFGEPTYDGSDAPEKSSCEWVLRFGPTIATIYDYRGPTFRVGGFDFRAYELVCAVLGYKGEK